MLEKWGVIKVMIQLLVKEILVLLNYFFFHVPFILTTPPFHCGLQLLWKQGCLYLLSEDFKEFKKKINLLIWTKYKIL